MTENVAPQPRTEIGTFARHEPTPELRARVGELAQYSSKMEAATVLGISTETINNYYKAEWDLGAATAVVEVKAKLFERAKQGHPNAIWKFLLMQHAVKPLPVELTGPNGGPISVDLTRLNEKQLEEYGRLAAIAEGINPDSILIERTDT